MSTTYYTDTIAADSPIFAGLGIIGGDGTVYGGTSSVSGPTTDTGDNGTQFDGSTGYVDTGLVSAPAGSGSFSVEFWIFPATGGAGGVVLGSAGSSGHVDNINISCSSSSGGCAKLDMSLGAGGTTQCLEVNGVYLAPNVRADTWNHAVFTFDGTIAKLFVNGIRAGIGNAVAAFNPEDISPLLIAAMGQVGLGTPTNYFDGALADFAIYDYPLSIQKVIKHFWARAGTPAYPDSSTFTGDYYPTILTDGPLVYYRCDETAGAQAVDRSGNKHHGVYGLGSTTFEEPGAIYDGDDAVLLQETPPGFWDATAANIVTPITSLSFTTQMSIECWLFPTSTPGTICASCGVIPSYDGPGFAITLGDDGKVSATLYESSEDIVTLTTPDALPAAQYNHVVVTFDETLVIIYVNGSPVASSDAGIVIGTNYANVVWGCYPVNFERDANQLLAAIDEPALYAFPLTPSQVYTHWKAGLGPLTPPPEPVVSDTDRHYWEVRIYDKRGQLVDIPKADIVELSLLDQLNGGSATSTMKMVRDINNIGAIDYLYSVLVWIWNGKIARPTNPTWNGYIVDIDLEKMRTSGTVTCHMEGDQKQLDRASVYEDVNPLVSGNPPLDAADYIRHLYNVYSPPGFCNLSCPVTLFSLLPGQYEMMQLGQVIDTVLKTGRDDLGNLITWRVNRAANLVRTLVVQGDQNPNTVAGVSFKHVFMEMCSKYQINTKYSELTNVVTVQGGQDYITGKPVVGAYIDEDSVAAFGAWEKIISVWQLISQTAADNYAQSYLDTYGNPQAQGSIELHAPDPSLLSGVWIQMWENASVVKQMRITSVRFEIGRSRIAQTLSPTAPTPYLDAAIYKMGLNSANNGVNLVNQLPVNNQQNFVRSGGTMSRV